MQLAVLNRRVGASGGLKIIRSFSNVVENTRREESKSSSLSYDELQAVVNTKRERFENYRF